MKSIIKLWNKNFDKGVSVFQMFLMAMMFFGAIVDNQQLILFSVFNCLFAYLEPNTPRFALKRKGERR